VTGDDQQQTVRALLAHLDRIDRARLHVAELVDERAVLTRAAVDTGLGARQLAALTDGRLSAGSVKSDLRRLPRPRDESGA
jgi:hypothetical protein